MVSVSAQQVHLPTKHNAMNVQSNIANNVHPTIPAAPVTIHSHKMMVHANANQTSLPTKHNVFYVKAIM